MAEPTNGPYRVSGYVRGASIITEDGTATLATMAHWANGDDFDELRADASLLAASWDLREALRAMLECYATPTQERTDYSVTARQAADMARAALAKAEGRER